MELELQFKEGIYVRDEDFDYQEKSVEPTREIQDVTADAGFDALRKVTVGKIPDNLVDTGDANATNSDIMSGKTAYVGGEKVQGTYVPSVGATVDSELSLTSENPVQNKVIANQFFEHEADINLHSSKITNLEHDLDDVKQSIPTKTSQLENDLGFVKDSEIKPIAKSGLLADAETDEEHRTVTDAEKLRWDAKQNALTIDNKLSDTSENPVQNKVVYKDFIDVHKRINGVEDTFYIDLNAPYIQMESSGIQMDEVGKADTLSGLVRTAYENRPPNADRVNIVFYDSAYDPMENGYERLAYLNKISLQNNCNYYFSKKIGNIDQIRIAGFVHTDGTIDALENCEFHNLNLTTHGEGEMLINIDNCKDVEFYDCNFGKAIGFAVKIYNCDKIYFENCHFVGGDSPSGLPLGIVKLFNYENTFSWAMFENCTFQRLNGVSAINASGVENGKHLLCVSNCHYDDLSKISKDDISAGMGKISIVATEEDLPTKTSDLVNDSGFATVSYVNEKASKVYRPCGSVNFYQDLIAIVDKQEGDVYDVLAPYTTPYGQTYPAGTNFVWNGSRWDELGGIIDLSNYALKSEIPTVPTKTSELENDGVGDGLPFCNNYEAYWQAEQYVQTNGYIKDTDLATETKNGAMSATDKAKLDTIEEGAKKYTVATPNNDGLMEASDKEFSKQMCLYCGKQYWAIGEVSAGSNPFIGSIVYTRHTRYRGTVAVTATLPSSVVAESSWLVDLDKIEALLKANNPDVSINFKAVTAPTNCGWWVSIPNATNYYGNYCKRGVTTETGAFVSRFINLYAQNSNGTETIKTTSGFDVGTVIHLEFPVEEV